MANIVEVVFILCFFVDFVVVQRSQDLGLLEIVSDLEPGDCFVDGTDYNPADAVYSLPSCTATFSPTRKCDTYYKPNNAKYKAIYKPTCAKDGSFGPVQCKGEPTMGRCFCFDNLGYRIFGQEWWANAANMTCGCSRKKADMPSDPKSEDYIFYSSLHCNSVGNYEPLQCDVVSEQCWCADEMTGDLTGPVVPQTAMTKLPCYNSLNVGTQYLRQCENKKFAQKNIEYRLSLRGTTASFGTYVCDGDGSFGVFTVTDGLAYCTWRDNSKIGSWASGDPDPDVLNCNCARDTRIFSDAGKEQLLKCDLSGNYQAYQGSGADSYCVDTDGFRKSEYDIDPGDNVCDPYISYTESH